MLLRFHTDDFGTQRLPEARHGVAGLGICFHRRRYNRNAALEQILLRVLRSVLLAPRHRMTADVDRLTRIVVSESLLHGQHDFFLRTSSIRNQSTWPAR